MARRDLAPWWFRSPTVPILSVITAVIDGRHAHLGAAHQSLLRQEMPDGWSWEWIVQEDGHTGRPLAALPEDPRISCGTGRPARAATARTLALERATGVLVRALDADDLLPAGALARDITTLTSHPEVGWCVSPALDLVADGRLVPGPRDPKPGRLQPGFLAAMERVGSTPVVGGTMCTYTELVRALGGWQALPASEDIALLLAAEAVADGWMLAEPGLIYRRWDGSSTVDPAHREAGETALRRAVLLGRADALRRCGWRWRPREDAIVAVRSSRLAPGGGRSALTPHT
jgi:hypothetical protein